MSTKIQAIRMSIRISIKFPSTNGYSSFFMSSVYRKFQHIGHLIVTKSLSIYTIFMEMELLLWNSKGGRSQNFKFHFKVIPLVLLLCTMAKIIKILRSFLANC